MPAGRPVPPTGLELQARRLLLARYPLTLVVAVAAVLGAAIIGWLGIDPYLNPDSHSFEAIARSLLAGHGFVYREPMFPSLPLYAFRSPGYSAFVALGLALGGLGTVVALQGALHGAAAALVGAIAGRWGGSRAAWMALAIYFVWPAAWSHAGQLMSESLFTFMTILTVWMVLRAERERRLAWAVGAGVVIAMAILVRPAGLGCAAAAGIWLFTRDRRAALAFLLAAVIAWAPWPARNAVRLHAFVPLLSGGGVAAWNTQANQPPRVAWEWMAAHTELGELGLDRHFRDTNVAIVRRDPMAAVIRAAREIVQYAGPWRDHERIVWLHRFAMLASLPALLWVGWRRRLLLPALVWGCQAVVLVPVAMHTRYRFPTEWCVVVFAAIGLQAVAVHWGVRRMVLFGAGGLAASILGTLALATG